MTRPKVDPDKRQRTAQACDSCKRRKQKCNGVRPCNTCSKRGSSCTYGESENGSDDQPSPKRRMVTDGGASSVSSPTNGPPPQAASQQFNLQPSYIQHTQSQEPPQWTPVPAGPPEVPAILQHEEAHMNQAPTDPVPLFSGPTQDFKKDTLNPGDQNSQLLSRGSTVSGQDEEAVVYSNTRMLQDPTGRLLYVGDSATLSFLQLIRMIVDNVSGPSPFTMDPRRHRIVENTISLPPNMRRTHLLPDRQTADVLVDSFFANTNGLIEIFHRKSFLNTLDLCYADPLNVDPSWLCHLYLTFAIGLVTAIPTPGTREDAIIQKLRAEPIDRAEMFYSDAKHLSDPLAGFEDAGFWSIQALTLMSVYMLTVSKRNAAYALYGMAVRSAFALGLHREETMCIFSGAEQIVRRNLWRSLYVLDRFLSASLGRPTSIRESDCSGDTLTTGEKPPFPQAPFPTAANAGFTGTLGLEASVRSCHVIGVILEKVYSQRKISTKLAQEIADHCKGWPKALDSSLHWRQANSADPTQGIAILHVNLLYCHSIVLLTRPFFLFLMNKLHQERRETGQRSQRQGTRMEKFGEACVVASCHSIVLVQNALEGRYLPRDPFVLYFLFASALIILSNEFSSLFENASASSCITNAINIMHYLAQLDPQANRLLFILTSFRDVVVRQNAPASQNLNQGIKSQVPPQHPSRSVLNENIDPIGDLFMDRTSAGMPPTIPATAGPPDPIGRHGSNPNVSPPNQLNSLNRPSSSSNDPINGDSLNNGHHQDMNIGASPNSMRGRQNSLDTFLDLARVSSNSGEPNDSFGGDEIDFESLWQWPNSNGTGLTPGPGSGSKYSSTPSSFSLNTPGAGAEGMPTGSDLNVALPVVNNSPSESVKVPVPEAGFAVDPLPSGAVDGLPLGIEFAAGLFASESTAPEPVIPVERFSFHLLPDGNSAKSEVLAVALTPGGSIGLVGAGGQVGMGGGGGPQIDVQGISDSSVPLFGMSNAEFSGN